MSILNTGGWVARAVTGGSEDQGVRPDQQRQFRACSVGPVAASDDDGDDDDASDDDGDDGGGDGDDTL